MGKRRDQRSRRVSPAGAGDAGAASDQNPGALVMSERAIVPPENSNAVPAHALTTAVSAESPIPPRSTILPRIEGPAEAPKLVSGKSVRYEEMKPLGEGAMGEVLLARDNDIQRMVAIKRLKHSDSRSNASVARFVEEIQTVGRLEHPNIAPIHDVGLDDAGHYFVMRYIEGDTLAKIIEKLDAGDAECHRRYTFEYRIQVFIKILEAIEYAHANGILHRDIKPENVIVGHFGEVMVMDWGIAKAKSAGAAVADASLPEQHSSIEAPPRRESAAPARRRAILTDQNGWIGTPAYMSPEQARGSNDSLDERSDIYSAAALFYEFLTLRYYLAGTASPDASAVELLSLIPKAEPVAAEQIDHRAQGRVPRELAFLVKRALSKDPAQRFQSVREMIDELQLDLQGRTCVYCTSTLAKRGVNDFAHFIDNHRTLGVATLIVVFASAAFGLVQAVHMLVSR